MFGLVLCMQAKASDLASARVKHPTQQVPSLKIATQHLLPMNQQDSPEAVATGSCVAGGGANSGQAERPCTTERY